MSKKVFIKDNSNTSHTARLIPLVSAKLAIFSESEQFEQLNDDQLKSLTGGDDISARELYGKQFSFKPIAKYILLTNHKPNWNSHDQAMMDRIRYIPFNARFVDSPSNTSEYKRDVEFIDKLLTTNLHEVFEWLCIGAYKYYKYMEQKKSFPIPKSYKMHEMSMSMN